MILRDLWGVMSNGKEWFGFNRGFKVFREDSKDVLEQIFLRVKTRFKAL